MSMNFHSYNDYNSGMNRRRFDRFEISDLYALLSHDGLSYLPGRVSNISFEGMFIESSAQHFMPMSDTLLHICVDGDLRSAEVDIVRVDANGVGLWIDRHRRRNKWMLRGLLPSK